MIDELDQTTIFWCGAFAGLVLQFIKRLWRKYRSFKGMSEPWWETDAIILLGVLLGVGAGLVLVGGKLGLLAGSVGGFSATGAVGTTKRAVREYKIRRSVKSPDYSQE